MRTSIHLLKSAQTPFNEILGNRQHSSTLSTVKGRTPQWYYSWTSGSPATGSIKTDSRCEFTKTQRSPRTTIAYLHRTEFRGYTGLSAVFFLPSHPKLSNSRAPHQPHDSLAPSGPFQPMGELPSHCWEVCFQLNLRSKLLNWTPLCKSGTSWIRIKCTYSVLRGKDRWPRHVFSSKQEPGKSTTTWWRRKIEKKSFIFSGFKDIFFLVAAVRTNTVTMSSSK